MESLLIIRPDGLWRFTPERLMNAEEILDRLTESSGVVLRDVARIQGNPVNLFKGAKFATVGVELPSIDIQTFFALVPDGGAIVPVYRDNGEALKQKRTWTIPEEFQFLFFYFEQDDYRQAMAVLRHRESGKCYLPPIGNMFDDSRVCMGSWNDLPVMRELSLVDRLGEAIAHFNNSEANTDLIGGNGGGAGRLPGSHHFLRWNPNDDTQLSVDISAGLQLLPSTSHYAWSELV